MTGQEQLDTFGLAAYADGDKVVIIAREDAVELDPYIARRWTFYLARAYHDAMRNTRRARTSTLWGPK
jgi:hypothetical protein